MKPLYAAVVALSLVSVSRASFADATPSGVGRPSPSPRDPSVGAAAALGRAELGRGQAVDAAEHFSDALARTPDTDPSWVDIVYDLAIARSMVVSLRVRASEPGASVYVDGRHVGDTPLAHEVFVDEGRHEVRVTLAGFDAASRSVHGRAGSAFDVELPLTPAAAPAPEPPPRAALARTEAAPLGGRRTWILVGGSLLSLGALGVGTGYAVAAITGHGEQDSVNRGAGVWLVTGGLLLGATVTYALWPAPASAPSEPPRLVVGVTPQGGGSTLHVAGTFGR